jgi:hypothetical protein
MIDEIAFPSDSCKKSLEETKKKSLIITVVQLKKDLQKG